jgi:chromodomain-helicase-DNA-binding protein 7
MPKAKSTKSSTKKTTTRSPTKSRGQHNNHRRRSVAKSVLEFDGDHDDDENDADSDVYMEEDYLQEEEEDGYESSEKEEDETMKIQRILAVRSETRKKWREICSKMTTSEVTDGSRWFQQSSSSSENDDGEEHNENENENNENNANEKDSILEERFLVKWNQLSYLHVSWETHGDLMDQVDNAKNYMSTFFRKQNGGLLFGQDERKDGDYFDPGLVQIDRILEVVAPEDYASSNNSNSKLPASWMEELAVGDPITEFGMVLDHKSDPDAFEAGAGRQFLVKWSSMNYFDSTYEFERDLMLMDQKDSLMEKLEEYYGRTKRPTRKELSALRSKAEDAKRRSYLFLGDNSRLDADQKEEQVKEYQESLTNHVFRNGGSLRDYQAEGVTWFLANYVNRRSCILADEMGLGKTLQTAAFVNLLVEKMHKRGPFLICVPLSTLAHWQREFIGWTGLNTIVYHGSAEDRKAIRENEFAFAKDRPTNVGGGINSLYLKKCEAAKKPNQAQWMATVVVTTPEMLVADDWTELSFVQWQVLVVDEAHRLKNHNSKLALTMRKEQFKFQHKLLLTGTPIQNDVKEFWTLLNFIDPDNYDDVDEFMEEYGDMKSKEKIDDLHEQIRPYILRRLKEDVEKSVPPKEETLIEVELTLSQKQYYRALYEKNVGFLHKNKKKALDGPSLNNLAMQLRKCCNHLFLLNGVEDDMREKEDKETLNEGDFVTNGSGKLVLLDKLLPRLKTDGHRVLIFSQFKIMLDILEDYLNCREYKFERIDGSITGNKRQSAIDRFQEPSSDPEREPPFVMLLSTRAGGVGINLTAADTCVIFDSDWNRE